MAIPIPSNLPINPLVDFHRNDLIIQQIETTAKQCATGSEFYRNDFIRNQVYTSAD